MCQKGYATSKKGMSILNWPILQFHTFNDILRKAAYSRSSAGTFLPWENAKSRYKSRYCLFLRIPKYYWPSQSLLSSSSTSSLDLSEYSSSIADSCWEFEKSHRSITFASLISPMLSESDASPESWFVLSCFADNWSIRFCMLSRSDLAMLLPDDLSELRFWCYLWLKWLSRRYLSILMYWFNWL